MENTLDIIAKGNQIWYKLCDECLGKINRLSEGLADIKRETIQIDKNNTYMIAKYGPIIKCTIGDKTTFKSVKDDIDIDKLRRGEYKLEEIITTKKFSGNHLGVYKGKDVILKKGKFGVYLEWGEIKKSLNINNESGNRSTTTEYTGESSVRINTNAADSNDNNSDDDHNITLEEAIKILSITSSPTLVRKIDNNTSIRTGKYGDYIFHKKPQWKKPSFLKLNGFISDHGKDSYKTCDLSIIKDWIYATYKI